MIPMYGFECNISRQKISKENCEKCSHPRKGMDYCRELKKAVMLNNEHKVYAFSKKL